MTVARTFRFPSGSLILYFHPEGLGELVLYSKKKINLKVFGDFEILEANFDKLTQQIEEGFVETARDMLRSLAVKM